MSSAYIIRAHKNPAQLARLVARLASPSASFVIHVNLSTPLATRQEMVEQLEPFDGVYWLPERRCYWGGFSLVQVTLDAIGTLVQCGVNPSHVSLLSGQDYPLQPVSMIERFFADHVGESFMVHFALPCRDGRWAREKGGLDRVERWHFETIGERIGFPMRRISLPLSRRRRLPGGLQPFGGSAFWSLSWEAARYVHETATRQPDIADFFRHTYIPDELFFHTVLMNSSLRDSIRNENLRFIIWDRGEPNPRILGGRDLDVLRRSGKLFARKFDPAVDERVLDALDEFPLGCRAT